MTPAQILLFLVLTASLTGRVHCQEGEGEDIDEDTGETEDAVEATTAETSELPDPTPSAETNDGEENIEASGGYDSGAGPEDREEGEPSGEPPPDELSPTIIIIPLVAVLVIISMVVAAVMISRRLRSKSAGSEPVQEDAYLDACEGEKVPMPMFEDDVPSVLELEMEDLEKWMVKDGGGSNMNLGPV
ncbi:transmembrane protein 154 [Sardina pilchardus]|uniref:transmembrane protein 154 n=1 Tax=Sardina pilchardus TaxID=27697 RepID=UPI002E134E1C